MLLKWKWVSKYAEQLSLTGVFFLLFQPSSPVTVRELHGLHSSTHDITSSPFFSFLIPMDEVGLTSVPGLEEVRMWVLAITFTPYHIVLLFMSCILSIACSLKTVGVNASWWLSNACRASKMNEVANPLQAHAFKISLSLTLRLIFLRNNNNKE